MSSAPDRRDEAVRALILLFLACIPGPVSAEDSSLLPSGAIGGAKPIQYYRELFKNSADPSGAFKALEGRRYECEHATFQPLDYHDEDFSIITRTTTTFAKNFIYPGIIFTVKSVRDQELTYGLLKCGVNTKCESKNLVAKKDKLGHFVAVEKSGKYPLQRGAMVFRYALRITKKEEIIMEWSYDVSGYPFPDGASDPLAPDMDGLGGRFYVGAYEICKSDSAAAGESPGYPVKMPSNDDILNDYLKKSGPGR